MFSRYIHETNGATAVEYGLIGGFIAVAVSAVAILIGEEIIVAFEFILGQLQR